MINILIFNYQKTRSVDPRNKKLSWLSVIAKSTLANVLSQENLE